MKINRFGRRLLSAVAAIAAAVGGSLLVAAPAHAASAIYHTANSDQACRSGYAVVRLGIALEPCIWPTSSTPDLGLLHPNVAVHEGTSAARVYWEVDPVVGGVVDTAHPYTLNGQSVWSALIPAGSAYITVGDAAGTYESMYYPMPLPPVIDGPTFITRSWISINGTKYGNVEGPVFWLGHS